MKVSIVLLLLALSACARGQMIAACRQQIGPEPYAAGRAFGLIGDMVAFSQPEHQVWQQQVDACVQKREVAGR